MPSRMRTRSATWPDAKSQGGGTVGWVGRKVEGVEGLGKIKKMENVQDMSGCSIDQKVNYTAGLIVGKALIWWNSQIRTLSQEVAIRGMVAATKPKTMQKAVQIFGALTDDAVRIVSIKKVEKKGNVEEPSKDKNDRDDNKRTKTGIFLLLLACYECGSADHVRTSYLRLNRAQDRKETVQTKLLLITRVRVMETKETKLAVGNSYWEQRKLARIQILGRRPREGNDEHVDDLNGQGNDQGMGANGGIEGVNRKVEGANRGAPDFLTIIAQQLQDLLPSMLAQVGNQGNVRNQNAMSQAAIERLITQRVNAALEAERAGQVNEGGRKQHK
nr:hypothetical protein [Tanacetum cinerariifolium]